MKKLLSLYIVAILVLSSLGAVAITNGKTNDMKIKIESIAISKPVIKDEGQYITVSFEEATASLSDSGKPMLPILTKVFTFPFDTQISSVDVSFSDTKELSLTKEIKPTKAQIPLDMTMENGLIKNLTTYESTELYPTRSYSYTVGAGLDGEEHVIYLAVQCYPIRYSPANNIISYSENAEIQVTYEEPATPTVFSDQYNLVIISPSEFSNELQPLINHKISMGVNTILKTTEEIYSEYSGRDNAEKIKYFIKDAIETLGIDYVLLVGSVDKLPIRTTYASFWEGDLITDLYYADIYNATGGFCSWDGNNNDKFGEVRYTQEQIFDIDGVDLYPDVNIGRLPCGTNAEVQTVVNKIINYETETYGASWFKNIILVGGDTFPGWGGNEGEEKNLITEQIMSDFTPTILWTSDGTFSAKSLNQAINKGAGFIDYAGHGFEIGVATHPPNSDTWVPYHTNHLLGATNGNKLPIIFFDACLTAKLDFNIAELIGYASPSLQLFVNKFSTIASRLFPTFAWCIVKKSNGGAIATIGATRTAFGGTDSGAGGLSLHFWRAYSTSETVSQMLTKAQNAYITNIPGDFFTVEEFLLIGDPSLKIGGYA
jgi:hypothetical protein